VRFGALLRLEKKFVTLFLNDDPCAAVDLSGPVLMALNPTWCFFNRNIGHAGDGLELATDNFRSRVDEEYLTISPNAGTIVPGVPCRPRKIPTEIQSPMAIFEPDSAPRH
jgi:hypothetical protein